MKRIIIISVICLMSIACFGQNEQSMESMSSQRIIDLPDKKHLRFNNINSPDFIRILDGLELEKDFKIPKEISINKIWKLSDSGKLAEVGLPYTDKPYMILNTSVNKIRQYIKSKANVPYDYYLRNLPVFIDGDLVTLNQYTRLNDLDTNTVRSIKFIKEVSTKKSQGYEMPWGAILIHTDE